MHMMRDCYCFSCWYLFVSCMWPRFISSKIFTQNFIRSHEKLINLHVNKVIILLLVLSTLESEYIHLCKHAWPTLLMNKCVCIKWDSLQCSNLLSIHLIVSFRSEKKGDLRIHKNESIENKWRMHVNLLFRYVYIVHVRIANYALSANHQCSKFKFTFSRKDKVICSCAKSILYSARFMCRFSCVVHFFKSI